MNLTQIQSECGRLLSDPTNDRWPLATLLLRINQAQTEIQSYTNAIKKSVFYTATASISYVTLSSSLLTVLSVTKTFSDGSIRPLPLITIQELNYLYPDFRQWTSGEPLYAYLDGTYQRLYLVPTPDTTFAATANAIGTYESQIPAALVNSTDIPFDSYTPMVPYHMSIVHWVVALCFQDDGTPESLAKSRFHKSGEMMRPGEYEKELGRILAEFDIAEQVPARVMFKPAGGRVGSWWIPSKSNPLTFP